MARHTKLYGQGGSYKSPMVLIHLRLIYAPPSSETTLQKRGSVSNIKTRNPNCIITKTR